MNPRDLAATPDLQGADAPHRIGSGLRERAALSVCGLGQWFRLPGGDRVSVERWRPLQRLLASLATHREIAPGVPLAVDDLIAAGWPGERMLPRAGATRVYTAIASLRRLGLREVLVRVEGGYMLTPAVPVERVVDA